MGAPINIINAQQHDLLPTESSIVRYQHNGLISCRAVRQDMRQDGPPLALIGNPGNRGGNRDQAALSATNTLSNRIERVLAMAQSNTPAVEAAHGTHPS